MYYRDNAPIYIDHLHASENILIAFLIAVTSQLDGVVTCTSDDHRSLSNCHE